MKLNPEARLGVSWLCAIVESQAFQSQVWVHSTQNSCNVPFNSKDLVGFNDPHGENGIR